MVSKKAYNYSLNREHYIQSKNKEIRPQELTIFQEVPVTDNKAKNIDDKGKKLRVELVKLLLIEPSVYVV